MIPLYFITIFLSLSPLAGSAIAFAQSGRTATPSPIPSALPITQTKPAAELRLLIDRNAPEYKLVFGAGDFKDFVAQLNQYGEQGYKLKSITFGWQKSDKKNYFRRPVAILQLDEVRYEYTSFETRSTWFWGIPAFYTAYAENARQGFRLVEHFYSGGLCAEAGDCELWNTFVLERPKGVTLPVQFREAGGAPRKRMKIDSTGELNDRAASGFYPTSLISKFQILLEEVAEPDRPLTKPDIQWTNLESRMKKLALEGYRLAFIHNEGIIVYRYPGSTESFRYIFKRTNPGKLEKELKTLEPTGATYRTADRDQGGDRLIFEMGSSATPRSFRVLRFNFHIVEDVPDHARINLTSADELALKTMNELAEQGYVVRTIFGHDHVGILLER